MSVFVRAQNVADIHFFVRSTSERIWLKTKEQFYDVPGPEKDKYEECHVFLQPLTWGKACQLQSQAMTSDPMTAQRVFDADNYVRMKLEAVISDWSFTEDGPDGKPVKVPVSPEQVDQLHPAVADFLLKEYSKRFELSEQDRKNS